MSTAGNPAAAPARLVDVASVLRSKNAGPFSVTLDVLLPTAELFDHVVGSQVLTVAAVAALYRVDPSGVRVIVFPPASAIKVTLPRRSSSGSADDTDVYGTQQHVPLLRLELPPPPVEATAP